MDLGLTESVTEFLTLSTKPTEMKKQKQSWQSQSSGKLLKYTNPETLTQTHWVRLRRIVTSGFEIQESLSVETREDSEDPL